MTRRRKRDGEFWFDAEAADRAVAFFAECLVHTKGELAGLPFVLDAWERDRIIRPLFGWKRADGTRRYRTVYVEVPKKNGKSSLAAGLALYLTAADGEPGAEVLSAAADKDQARIVFDTAKRMRAASVELRKRTRAFKDAIVVPSSASSYRVLSADAPTKHGLNPHAIMFDELHAQPNRDLWDTLTTGVAARRQPVIFVITTAGFDRLSICWEIHEYAERVLADPTVDPTFLAVIYAAAPNDDWRDPAVWAKANPGLGVSVKRDYLDAQVKKAEHSLAYQNTFKRLHLNVWTENVVRWLDADKWDACGAAPDLDALAGRECFAGLDLSTTTDVTAFVLVFPPVDDPNNGTWDVVPFFWVPAARVKVAVARDRVPYDVWQQAGYLTATEGDVVDYDVVRAFIRETTERFRIREIAYDRWNATQLVSQLLEDGATMVPFGQGFASMNMPTKELESLVNAGRVRHGGHPVLRWMAANVVLAKDAADNWKPAKNKSAGRIDGIVATIMGIGRATTQPPTVESAYNDHRLVVV